MGLSERPLTYLCRFDVQWSVNNPVSNLHCFLSKALVSYSEGPSLKCFDCLMRGVAAQYSVCILVSQSILSMPTHGETGIAGSGPKNGLPDPFLAKASTSSLP
jgi:hypothetical protein